MKKPKLSMNSQLTYQTKLVGLISFLLILASCDDNNSVLELTSPTSNDIVEYCCIDFEWKSNSELDDHNFTLAADMNFDSILVESSDLGKLYSLKKNLASGSTYYWKVSSKSLELERKSSFEIVDYISRYEGTYSATFAEYVWNIGIGFDPEVTTDTSYLGEVTIMQSTKEDHIQLSYSSETSSNQLDFRLDKMPNSSGSLFFWDDKETNPRIQKQGSLYLKQDSLRYTASLDTNGGGSTFKISAKLK